MKYLIRYIAISLILVGFLLTSCTDLSQTVFSEVRADQYEPSANDIVSVIGPIYTPLRKVMDHGWLSVDHAADMIVTPTQGAGGWFDGGRYNRIHRHSWTATDATPNSVWNMAFDGINAANRVLLQIETGEIPIEDNREGIIAELKCVRAFYYSILLDTHGNVPIVTDFSSEELPTQNTREEVYNFVVQELTENIQQLSEVADQSTYGRFNKWAGKMVLAEVYLNAKVYVGERHYQDVLEVTNDYQEWPYELEENYKDNFIRENQNSSEIIFAVPYDHENAPGNMYLMRSVPPSMQEPLGMGAQPYGGARATPQFINTYHPEDSRLEDTWLTGPHYIDGLPPEAPENFVNHIPRIAPPGSEYYNGYPIIKYEPYEGVERDSDVDFPFYRYAETLMMRAEALLRTGNASEAADLVTQVRMRAFEDPADAQVTGTQLEGGSNYIYGWWQEDGTIQNPDPGNNIQYGRMLDELGWEFAAEGNRRQDLIRWGLFTTKIWMKHEPNGDGKILFPIPESALNTNTNLEQNPGY